MSLGETVQKNKKLLIIIAIGLLIIYINPKLPWTRSYHYVALTELAANPEKYDGTRVKTSGVVSVLTVDAVGLKEQSSPTLWVEGIPETPALGETITVQGVFSTVEKNGRTLRLIYEG